MKDDISISLQDLGIRYRRYLRQHRTLKDLFVNRFRGSQYESFWALRNISLELKRGESVGVIGPNGSGKSTLLSAINGVLPPAEGHIEIRGRVSAIALGGGFAAELTGRENIYLSGALHGLDSQTMRLRESEIIDFADIGDFIDAPVQTYSSGMRSRLAFAVAIEVDADILLLDEVFAVGDAQFKQKARDRMEQLFQSGRTVVTVSHNLALLRNLCNRVVYVLESRIKMVGSPEDVIPVYREDQGLPPMKPKLISAPGIN
ncbi:MAG: ABC transporter ATP-binding protein [Myxococcota bacterium]